MRGGSCGVRGGVTRGWKEVDCLCFLGGSPSRRESLDQALAKTGRGFPDSRWSNRDLARPRRKKSKNLQPQETNIAARGDETVAPKRLDCSEGNGKKQK